MDFLSLIPGILNIGKQIAAVIPGTTDDRIVALAEKYVGVVQDVVPIVRGTHHEVPANQTLAELVERVEAHADATAAKLRG